MMWRAPCAAALGVLALASCPTGAQDAQQSGRHPRSGPPIYSATSTAEATAAHPGSSPLAALRLEQTPTRYRAWADNPLPGPVQVELITTGARGLVASPALPIRKLVPARGSVLLSTLIIADPQSGSDFQLRLDAQPGDPRARPLGVTYRLPFNNAQVRVDQGPGGRFSHNDVQNHDAVDFALAEGTIVLAAREGVVMQVESDFDKAGLGREQYGGRSNFIRILHSDGTMAVYAHLKPEGVLVQIGESVRAGQRIGLSGNTGFSTAPHLHFVIQVNTGMRLASIPFEMSGALGILRFAQDGS